MEHQALLSDIEAFCAARGMSEAKFGVLSVNDWKLVNDLRGLNRPRPRRLWPETEREIRSFMAGYVLEKVA